MKFVVTLLILVFVVFAVFAFLFAVDPRYTLPLPGMEQIQPQPQPQQHQVIPPNDIQTLLSRLHQIDEEIMELEDRSKNIDIDLQLLKDQRSEVRDEIIEFWTNNIKNKIGPQNARQTSIVEKPVQHKTLVFPQHKTLVLPQHR